MMDEAAEKKMVQALGTVLEQDMPKPPTPIRPTPAIDDQLAQIERIEQSIRNRIRQDRLTILAEFERTQAEIRSSYEQKASDTLVKLGNERDLSLRNLHEETQRKLHELGRQAERIERT
jgi:hypothetical protein